MKLIRTLLTFFATLAVVCLTTISIAQNDLICEDWRSRDQSWDYCRIALEFFQTIPFHEMAPADHLIGNPGHDNSKYCFAKENEIYLVYLPDGGSTGIDLSNADGEFKVSSFSSRSGGTELTGSVGLVKGGGNVSIGSPPEKKDQDWVVVLRK